MGVVARMKSKSGGSKATPQITPTTTVDLSLTEDSDVFLLVNSGACTIPTINSNMPIHAGRHVTLIGDPSCSGNFTLTNNADTTTKGQMDLGAGDITLASEDVLVLVQQSSGVWFEASLTDN